MRKKTLHLLFVLFFGVLSSSTIFGQAETDSLEAIPDTTSENSFIMYLKSIVDTNKVSLNFQNLPDGAFANTENLNLRGADVKDVLRGIGRQFDINILVDNSINRQVTLRLSNLTVIEALIQICQEYNLTLRQTGQIFRVREFQPTEPKPVVEESVIQYRDGQLNLDLKEIELREFARRLSLETDENIIVRNSVRGVLSGYLQGIDFEIGLSTILSNNGYSLREKDGVFIIDRMGFSSSGEDDMTQNFWITVDQGLVSMDVVNANVTDIIREIGYQSEASMITYGLPGNTITAKINNLSIDDALNYIFRGTSFTYRKEADIYIIGDKATSGIASTKLIRLEHIRSDVVIELIPESIIQNATVQVIKEQNGLMVIGTNDIILELENFINEIDFPTPQIMIEALVVDVQTSDMYELGASLALGGAPDSSYFNPFSALFGQPGQNGRQSGGLVMQGDGDDANKVLAPGGNLFGIANLGRLPNDFYFRIQALSQEGLVNIKSRPQISTLNGHTASIEIGTTQYFLLKSTTPLQSPNQIVTQETERFEQIEANVLLEITPWVSASGEVTAEIHPEFNTPVGNLSAEVPPTINSRVLDSTVRLKDGETIILGGLIQESEVENLNKVPILGDIPLLGRLFRNKYTSMDKSELVIFITPHVFYGDGDDNLRWNRLRDKLDLSIDE
ncbi:secretin and TonB N-terminal domain-containing protein [Gracilimonas tropica]|uniref:secretin and TonB N-terminal domain-containing protein n=1 Tax=Gracilimonas tropica TaxID=454600 RepID=UPI000477FAC2|nr:secretin and TonB N-terminal domain-containing protein [Gracilimonas tropica]